MKIALIGASGFVGKALTRELLDRHHEVTAIVRHPEALDAGAQSRAAAGPGLLHAVKGDVFKPDEIAALVKGHDVVISAYNPGWTNPAIYQEFISGSEAIQQAVKKAGVKRFIV